ncbi:MAG TPA: excinuclease ABC subunit C [Candidatus Omnitrophica bacterium]|nr:MAG: hypothetical protein A2Z81_01890 [Omnitrophica WOR_2 bacterium GWA2_45_18]OGX21687.1 MAG: hypothetical protein A2Y04_03095 [Omnitrophica WOR_2 bacterium GWC2_45_7]HBR14376.1 excinuclease ABC subunit C [Candidatus Omnitrophota bacterium]
MHYVYILQSQTDREKYYVGLTDNIERRLGQHNHSPTCNYTKKYAPWELRMYLAFKDRQKASEFEVYLKSPSGKAFLQKRLI